MKKIGAVWLVLYFYFFGRLKTIVNVKRVVGQGTIDGNGFIFFQFKYCSVIYNCSHGQQPKQPMLLPD